MTRQARKTKPDEKDKKRNFKKKKNVTNSPFF